MGSRLGGVARPTRGGRTLAVVPIPVHAPVALALLWSPFPGEGGEGQGRSHGGAYPSDSATLSYFGALLPPLSQCLQSGKFCACELCAVSRECAESRRVV